MSTLWRSGETTKDRSVISRTIDNPSCHKIPTGDTQEDSTLSGRLAHPHEWVRVAEAAGVSANSTLSPTH